MLYDSSVLIDYLDGRDAAVEYIESHLDERAVAPQLVLFEVYQGEVFKSGPTNFDAVDGALGWLAPVETSAGFARAGAQVQAELDRRGEVLSARDAFIAGAAVALDERLVVADDDFDTAGLRSLLDVEFPYRDDATQSSLPSEDPDDE
jgi:tRNA(fMet)-specific endonuclease VapC